MLLRLQSTEDNRLMGYQRSNNQSGPRLLLRSHRSQKIESYSFRLLRKVTVNLNSQSQTIIKQQKVKQTGKPVILATWRWGTGIANSRSVWPTELDAVTKNKNKQKHKTATAGDGTTQDTKDWSKGQSSIPSYPYCAQALPIQKSKKTVSVSNEREFLTHRSLLRDHIGLTRGSTW